MNFVPAILLFCLIYILVINTLKIDNYQNFGGYKYYFNNTVLSTARTPIHTPPKQRIGLYAQDYHWCYGADNYSRSRLGKVSHNYEPACQSIKDMKYYA